MAAVVVAPKAVAVKVAGPQSVAVVKGMAVDGQVERAIPLAEGAAMHRLTVVKSRFGAALAQRFCREGAPAKTALVGSLRGFAAMAAPHVKH